MFNNIEVQLKNIIREREGWEEKRNAREYNLSEAIVVAKRAFSTVLINLHLDSVIKCRLFFFQWLNSASYVFFSHVRCHFYHFMPS